MSHEVREEKQRFQEIFTAGFCFLFFFFLMRFSGTQHTESVVDKRQILQDKTVAETQVRRRETVSQVERCRRHPKWVRGEGMEEGRHSHRLKWALLVHLTVPPLGVEPRVLLMLGKSPPLSYGHSLSSLNCIWGQWRT